MTLIGKIFTVLIFVMSIAFMMLSIMVFATHRNWREYAEGTGTKPGLKQELEKLQALKNEALTQQQQLRTQLAEEQAARKHALAGMTARLVRAENELAAKQQELDTLAANHTQVSAAANTAQQRLTALETEIGQIRNDLRKTEQDLDQKFLTVVDLTDQLNQAVALRDHLNLRNKQAVDQIAQMKQVMDANGLTIDSLVSHIPPKVEGVVLEVSDKDLIEISIGADDGLKVGHAMEVYRDNTYLGRIVIRRTAPDRAVGQIMKELQRGQIKRGDRVSTKLS